MQVCGTCGQPKPVRQFRAGLCRSCRSRHEKFVRQDKLAQDFSKALDDFQSNLRAFVAQSRGDNVSAPHPMEIYAGVIDRFGGIDALCDVWFHHIQQALASKPGSKLALDQFWKLSQFAQEAIKLRESSPSVAQLTIDQLNHEVLRILGPDILPALRAINPEAAATLVLKMGGGPQLADAAAAAPIPEEEDIIDVSATVEQIDLSQYRQENPDDPEDVFTFIPAEEEAEEALNDG